MALRGVYYFTRSKNDPVMSLHTNIIFNLQHNTSKVPVSNTSESVPTDKEAATSDFNKVMLGS